MKGRKRARAGDLSLENVVRYSRLILVNHPQRRIRISIIICFVMIIVVAIINPMIFLTRYHISYATARIFRNKPVFYSSLRDDRSGAVIHDMLFAHAHAYRHNLEYGGACSYSKDQRAFQEDPLQQTHRNLLQAVGLSNVLNIKFCQREETYLLLPKNVYYRNDEYFSHDYLTRLHSLRQSTSNAATKVAIHIRRGDVTPCFEKYDVFNRYSPNQLYLDVLHKVMAERPNYYHPSQVEIFSETESKPERVEPAFAEYNLRLDGNVTDAWVTMANAEVFILSKSSFSYIP